ncbi:prolyl oligopeptidase family serine peptidase [candidate division KSB1 bacterium]
MKQRLSAIMFFFLILLLMTVSLTAQEKKTFKIEDFGRWRSISSTVFSEKGNWITYAYQTPEKDDTLYVENLNTGKQFIISGGGRAQISDDEKWAAYNVSLPVKEQEKLKKAKKPVPVKAELLNLETGEKYTVPNSSSFTFSKGSKFFVVKKTKLDKEAKQSGTDLLIKNLATGMIDLVGSVKQFEFNKPGTLLAFTIDAADTTGNGLFILELNTYIRKPLDTGKFIFEKMTWNEEGSALAVLKGKKNKDKKERDNTLIAYTGLDKNMKQFIFDPARDDTFTENMVISEKGNIAWTENREKIFFGIKEQVKDEKRDKDADPLPDVDVWHWNDERIQANQMISAGRDRNFTYRSVLNLKDMKYFRLADERMRSVDITRDGAWAIGQDGKDYISDWKERQSDIYRINTDTGEKTLVIKGQMRTFGLSPDSKHFLMWRDGHIWDYNIPEGKMSNLTGNAPVSFVNEEYDHPDTKPAYGIAGWSKDGKSVILQHRYDLWRQPFDGKPAENLTKRGAEDEIVFRYVQTDREERFIDLSKPLLLTAFGQWTKKAGFFRLNKSKLEELVYEDKYYGRVNKAKGADKYMYTIETAVDFPNINVSDGSFNNPKKVTDAVPWQSKYKWGTNKLIEYTNSDGVRLQGVLSVPDDYRQGQKLPMLVDFYEKNSGNLNRYSRMIYRDSPMFFKWVSNGYLTLRPDVHFNTGTTHSDMQECVEAAVKEVIRLGYVDPGKVGVHGHSFSGQGSAFIATHSDMFAAICYGAGATNLVSDFNQLWKSSGTNQHRYDYYGQGRFGTNPFDDLDLYIQESSVYHARNMNTPLLIMHGTSDGSVEWLQAVEFYNALRFNGKNVILLAYPEQGHHLDRLENKKDFQLRMEQFFDHYLKGKESPEWMTEGVPFLKKKK